MLRSLLESLRYKDDAEMASSRDWTTSEKLEFDPTFNGPLNKRSCTDVICLLIFVAFVVGWGGVGYYALSEGNVGRLIAPIDSNGNRCGVDESVIDKPYLFYFDITKCLGVDAIVHGCGTTQVCVERCPDEFFFCAGDQSNASAICKDGYHDGNDCSDNSCAQWYLPSRNVAQRCIPLPKDETTQKYFDELANLMNYTAAEIKEGSKVAVLLSQGKEFGEMVVKDLTESWPMILAGLALSMLLCLVYIVLMRWFAGVMVWLSLFGVIGLLCYCVYASYDKWASMDDSEPSHNYGSSIEGRFNSVLALKDTWMVFLVASAILLAVVVLMVFFLRSRIRVAVALIREASRAVSSVISTLGFPLVPWVLQILVVAWAVTVGLHLAATIQPTYSLNMDNNTCVCDNDYQNGSSCTPHEFQSSCYNTTTNLTCKDATCSFVRFEQDSVTGYLHAFNIFGFFWGLFFMSAFGEMVLASTFATWYWTFKKSDVPFFTLSHGIARVLRYHLGTLAFGSLILAICRMIRVILEYLSTKLRKYDNAFVKAILCCLKCFFWCLEKFIQFINRNAYIMCAIHGKNFCRSAKDAFNLLMRNCIRVFVLDKVTDFLLFLGKLMITAAVVALAFFFFSDRLDTEELVPHLNYYMVPVIVVGIGTYFIASVFFGVYAMAVDTLFLCFLEDGERNDGSLEKPYFMSKQLMSLLGKKNKKHKQK